MPLDRRALVVGYGLARQPALVEQIAVGTSRDHPTTGGRDVEETAYRSRLPANAPAMPLLWNNPPTSS